MLHAATCWIPIHAFCNPTTHFHIKVKVSWCNLIQTPVAKHVKSGELGSICYLNFKSRAISSINNISRVHRVNICSLIYWRRKKDRTSIVYFYTKHVCWWSVWRNRRSKQSYYYFSWLWNHLFEATNTERLCSNLMTERGRSSSDWTWVSHPERLQKCSRCPVLFSGWPPGVGSLNPRVLQLKRSCGSVVLLVPEGLWSSSLGSLTSVFVAMPLTRCEALRGAAQVIAFAPLLSGVGATGIYKLLFEIGFGLFP